MRLNEYGLAPISFEQYVQFRSKLPRMWTCTLWCGGRGVEHWWDSDMEYWAFIKNKFSGIVGTLKFPKGVNWDSHEAYVMWIQKLTDLNKEHFGEAT